MALLSDKYSKRGVFFHQDHVLPGSSLDQLTLGCRVSFRLVDHMKRGRVEKRASQVEVVTEPEEPEEQEEQEEQEEPDLTDSSVMCDSKDEKLNQQEGNQSADAGASLGAYLTEAFKIVYDMAGEEDRLLAHKLAPRESRRHLRRLMCVAAVAEVTIMLAAIAAVAVDAIVVVTAVVVEVVVVAAGRQHRCVRSCQPTLTLPPRLSTSGRGPSSSAPQTTPPWSSTIARCVMAPACLLRIHLARSGVLKVCACCCC